MKSIFYIRPNPGLKHGGRKSISGLKIKNELLQRSTLKNNII